MNSTALRSRLQLLLQLITGVLIFSACEPTESMLFVYAPGEEALLVPGETDVQSFIDAAADAGYNLQPLRIDIDSGNELQTDNPAFVGIQSAERILLSPRASTLLPTLAGYAGQGTVFYYFGRPTQDLPPNNIYREVSFEPDIQDAGFLEFIGESAELAFVYDPGLVNKTDDELAHAFPEAFLINYKELSSEDKSSMPEHLRDYRTIVFLLRSGDLSLVLPLFRPLHERLVSTVVWPAGAVVGAFPWDIRHFFDELNAGDTAEGEEKLILKVPFVNLSN